MRRCLYASAAAAALAARYPDAALAGLVSVAVVATAVLAVGVVAALRPRAAV